MPSFYEFHERTIAIYDKHAVLWDKHRSRSLREKSWLNKFLLSLPNQANLLDVGCGAGEPISRYFIEQNHSVTGIDSSQTMIDICRSRFSDHEWIVMDMRELSLEEQFDGIVAWDSFFHLNPDEQRHTLQRFIQHLCPGGSLLLTIGHEAGEVLGEVEGKSVYHSSLSPSEYRSILNTAGFENIQIAIKDETCDRTVLLATQINSDALP